MASEIDKAPIRFANEGDDLLLSLSQNLMAVLLDVLATADMNPVVATIGGFHNELIEVGVGLEP